MESSPSSNSPPRLQDTTVKSGFPAHIRELLGGGNAIPFPEIFCRLVHVCMVEVGFVPILGEHDYSVQELIEIGFMESSIRFVNDLKTIVDRVGSLHNVVYKVVASEEEEITIPSTNQGATESMRSSDQDLQTLDALDPEPTFDVDTSKSVPVLEKGSEERSLETSEVVSNVGSMEQTNVEIAQKKLRKVISSDISVCIIHDGLEMYVVGSGPDFHRNIQVSIQKYIRTPHQIPGLGKANDYLELVNFSVYKFVDDVKRKFCYPIMDEINGFSFDIRSLAYMPPEIIVEIAKRCSPLSVFRLRATCTSIRNALSNNNQQLWKSLLKRDFPYCNVANLASDPSEEKYFRKYSEMCLFTVRRPLRRTFGRIFPFYMLNNFRV